MKITLVSYIYPYPERGYNPGVERVVQETARELVRQDHEVHVITTYRNGGNKKYQKDDRVKIHRVPDTRSIIGRPGSTFSLDLLSLNTSIKSKKSLLEDSDVVHTFTPIVWKFFDTPLVAHYHHWDDPVDLIDYLYMPTSQRLWLRCYDIADKIFAVSQYSANDLASRGPSENKISVIPNGVDTDKYSPDSPEVEAGDYENILLYVGPIMDRKGLNYLIESLPHILQIHPNTVLMVVGGGDRGDLLQQAEQIGVKDNVEFKGFVSDDILPEYYSAADIFVFPSLLEGFGMVLLEAMSSGLPVVASDTSAIPEVVGPGGCLVPKKEPICFAETVNDLLDDYNWRKALGDNARKHVENEYIWKKTVSRAVSEYEKLNSTTNSAAKSENFEDGT